MISIKMLLIIANLLSLGEITSPVQYPKKPDLIIESVEYTLESPTIVDGFLIVTNFGKAPSFGEFTIRIGNVGRREYREPFYLSWADNDRDIRTGAYSNGRILNQERDVIPVGGSVSIRLRAPLYSLKTVVRFFIQHDGAPRYGINIPPTDEIYTDNNGYDLTIYEQ